MKYDHSLSFPTSNSTSPLTYSPPNFMSFFFLKKNNPLSPVSARICGWVWSRRWSMRNPPVATYSKRILPADSLLGKGWSLQSTPPQPVS